MFYKILTGLLLFFSPFLYSQEETQNFTYNFPDGDCTYIEVSTSLAPIFSNFITWAEHYDYDFSKRIRDIKGIYHGKPVEKGAIGETFFFKDEQDYIIIDENIWLSEVLTVILFHEMYHILANTQSEEDHCRSPFCSGIMYSTLEGNLQYVLCNWNREVEKLFNKLKTVKSGESKDHITKCKIFSRGKD